MTTTECGLATECGLLTERRLLTEHDLFFACFNGEFGRVKEIIEQMFYIELTHSLASGYTAFDYFVMKNGPVDILRLMIDRLADKQTVLDQSILLFNISDDMILFLLDAGADPNAREDHTDSNFTRLLRRGVLHHMVKALLDHGAAPNSPNRRGSYALDACSPSTELLLMQYGATKSKFPCNLAYRAAFIIIDMMLYGMGLKNDWIIGIKGYIY